MKNSILIIGILTFIAMSCEEPEPEPIPESIKLSEYIIGNWENEMFPDSSQILYFTFSSGTYSIQYSVNGQTFQSDPTEYFVNDEMCEIKLMSANFPDYKNGMAFDVVIPVYYIEMTSEDVMTWAAADGNVYIFTR